MKVERIKTLVGGVEVLSEEGKLVGVNWINELKQSDKLSKIGEQVEEYLRGERREFEMEVKLEGTEFQKRVWQELMKVAYGTTVSYKGLAKRMGKPLAVRAVAGACGANKVPIVVPCHRVVSSSGGLGGYSGGVERKKWLLKLEGLLTD